MSTDTRYIDLTPDKCISIPDRHILIKRYKSDDSYYQDRPTNTIENILLDLIVEYRSELAQLRAADIRTFPHCDECGALLVIGATQEDDKPFCAVCELREARATLAEQARELETARELRELSKNLVNACGYFFDAFSEPQDVLEAELTLGNWLALHPEPDAEAHPAPESSAEPQQTKKETCKCVVAEKPVRPCNVKCWHFGADSKSVCQNCYNTGIQQP